MHKIQKRTTIGEYERRNNFTQEQSYNKPNIKNTWAERKRRANEKVIKNVISGEPVR